MISFFQFFLFGNCVFDEFLNLFLCFLAGFSDFNVFS